MTKGQKHEVIFIVMLGAFLLAMAILADNKNPDVSAAFLMIGVVYGLLVGRLIMLWRTF